MPSPDQHPTPPPPEARGLIDEALALTGGDVDAALRLVERKMVEDDAAAPARAAWVRWLRRNFQHRWRAP